MPTNDNDPDFKGVLSNESDPHGQAALVLVESLMHGLMERSVHSISDSIEIVETAIDVQAEFAEATDRADAPSWRSHALLRAIANSLQHDVGYLDGEAQPA